MSEAVNGMDSANEQNSTGPDYFGYYTREVAELLLQDTDLLPSSSKNPEFVGNAKDGVKEKDVCKNNNTGNGISSSIGIGPLFCDATGAELSDINKERLRVILRQSVVFLSREVDEIFDPVINMCRIKSRIRQEKCSTQRVSATCEENVEKHPRKKPKFCSSSSSPSLHVHASPDSCSPTRKIQTTHWKDLMHWGHKASHLDSNVVAEQEEVNDDLQILLANVGEDRIMKHSDILSTTLGCMQQKLEELLDIVMSSCRTMTQVEKQQLCKLIKNLPPENLNRVVEILRRRNPLDGKSKQIDVNLEHEDNTALWRLYYYVQAYENAKKLRHKSSSGK